MTKITLTKAALVAALVLTPVVIGRYGAPLAGFLRADVLIGIGTVATLVALITLEYGRRTVVPARALASSHTSALRTPDAAVVPFPRRDDDDRAAA